jgi:hypothetical protein
VLRSVVCVTAQATAWQLVIEFRSTGVCESCIACARPVYASGRRMRPVGRYEISCG